ncbi:MAG TPA: prepilin-type N-terminal cleavage/methylation domain-containing protein [Gemmatimonadales bacterium]
MPLLARRGFTLIELMIALVLLGIVSAGIYKVLVGNQRIYMAQTQQIDLQQNLRAAATILPAEFRELDAADDDITAMGPDSIRMRAMRQLAFVCATPVLGGGIGQITLMVRPVPIYGTRTTIAKDDSLLVYWEGNALSRNDDQWLPAQVKQVPVPGVCSDGSLAIALSLDPTWLNNPALNRVGAITDGSPVRGFDKLTYRVYQAGDGHWYLGQKNSSKSTATIQPLIGPLIGSNGVTFSYFTAAGAVTTDRLQVGQIGIVVRAQTAAPVRGPTGSFANKVDSVVTLVTLRNNPRCGPGAPAGAPNPCP